MIARPWTDDLPKCRNTCVASYFFRLGGNTNNSDDYLCFHCQTEDNSSLYGIFEPHNGLEAARFIMQRMAAELYFPSPSANDSDEEIRERLRNAFLAVEKAYVENYYGLIAERTSLQYQLLQTLNEQQIVAYTMELQQTHSGHVYSVKSKIYNIAVSRQINEDETIQGEGGIVPGCKNGKRCKRLEF